MVNQSTAFGGSTLTSPIRRFLNSRGSGRLADQSFATVMLLCARANGLIEGGIVLAAMTAVILLTLLALLAAGPLMKLIGAKLEGMITRILGVILAALAVQFVLDGLERSLPGLAG